MAQAYRVPVRAAFRRAADGQFIMISGVVTPDREAIIRIEVRGATSRRKEIDAVIDTGFNGSLSLPPPMIAQLRLAWRRRGRAMLADGTDSIFDIYEGKVVWDGSTRRISVDEANTAPLVGMALLENCELTIEVRSAGRVMIQSLP